MTRTGTSGVVPQRTKGTILIANYHTGGITFPRKSENGVLLKPLRLPPGTTTPVDAAEWVERKQVKVVQLYMDKGLIAEVTENRPVVPVTSGTSSELEIPEHLLTDEEAMQGQEASAKAKVVRKNVGVATIG